MEDSIPGILAYCTFGSSSVDVIPTPFSLTRATVETEDTKRKEHSISGCVYVYVFVYVCMCVCVYVYVFVYVCMCVYLHAV